MAISIASRFATPDSAYYGWKHPRDFPTRKVLVVSPSDNATRRVARC
jgi:hypothetical protein